MFTTPAHLTAQLLADTEDAYLQRANQQVVQLSKLIADGNTSVSGHGWFKVHYVTGTFKVQAVTRNTDKVVADARQVALANVALLEERVSRHLSETDIITGHTLFIFQGRIEGKVYGTTKDQESFRIQVRMMWNYRYGENSANGVITQYAQFRSERHGARQEGKPVVTQKQAAAEEAKAERQAAKEARRTAQLGKFKSAPARVAKSSRKDIAFWGEAHPDAKIWAQMADYAETISEGELEELFDKGLRTSGDLERYIEKQIKSSALVAA